MANTNIIRLIVQLLLAITTMTREINSCEQSGHRFPASIQFKDGRLLNRLTQNKNGLVMGIFKTGGKLETVFQAVAQSLRGKVVFAHGNGTAESIPGEMIFLYPPQKLRIEGQHQVVMFQGVQEAEEVEKFIRTEFKDFEGIPPVDDSYYEEIIAFMSLDTIVTIYVDDVEMKKEISEITEKYEDIFQFDVKSSEILSNEMETEFGLDVFGSIDMKSSEKPIIRAYNLIEKKKYLMKDEFSLTNFDKFLGNLKAGKLEPLYKSQAIPLPIFRRGEVLTVVADNFDKVVMQNGKDTLIEFYGPSCKHCKNLEPIYKELAILMKDEDVFIFIMNAAANDIPSGFDVTVVPKIYWIPRNRKLKSIEYTGNRELEDLIKFIAEQSTDGLTSYDREGKARNVPKEQKVEL